jgi:hypothetical protein
MAFYYKKMKKCKKSENMRDLSNDSHRSENQQLTSQGRIWETTKTSPKEHHPRGEKQRCEGKKNHRPLNKKLFTDLKADMVAREMGSKSSASRLHGAQPAFNLPHQCLRQTSLHSLHLPSIRPNPWTSKNCFWKGCWRRCCVVIGGFVCNLVGF